MAILDPDMLRDEYQKSRTAMKTYWDPFEEYERISRNRPHPKVVAAKLPTVTDGTLAGIIIAQPKRIVQRIPTGGITSIDQPDLAEIADFIWTHDIIPNANTNGDVLQKSWVMLSKALTYGVSVSYDFFKNTGDYFGADFKVLYIKDVILERGKVFGPDCNVLYMDSWYTPLDLKQIIDKETKLQGRSKRRGDEYKSPWDIQKLKKALELAHPKEPNSLNPSEREKSPESKFIHLVHAFQNGVSESFYTFCPDLPVGEDVVRTKKNPDPRGKMPLNFLYADIDLSNPLGRGHIELSGAMQNMIDSEVQAYQLMQRLMLNPPIMKWGDAIRGSTVKYKPNAVWDMGSDPNSKIETVNINNEAIANFTNNYGLMKSQILALTHNQETSSSSANTGGTQSKTHAGVQQQQQVIGFDDNYMRKQYESWWEANSETMLNIHFAESNGQREIQLTEDFISDTMPKMQNQPPQVQILAEKKQAIVDYGQIKTQLRFTVDPTSSEVDDKETQLENLTTLLQETGSNPYIYYYMLNDGYQLKLGEAYKDVFKRLGVQGIDKIMVKLPDDSNMQDQLRGVMNPLYDKPKVDVPYIALPPAGQIQAAANAGITLSLADVLGGPVIDPNIRGAGENAAIPGVQDMVPNADWQGQGTVPNPDSTPIPPLQLQQDQQEDTQGGSPQPATQPDQQIPLPSQQQQQQPHVPPGHVMPGTVPTPHQGLKRNQSGGLMPQNPEPQQQSIQDKDLAKAFIQAGYSNRQTMHAIVLANHGKTHDEILQLLGAPENRHG